MDGEQPRGPLIIAALLMRNFSQNLHDRRHFTLVTHAQILIRFMAQ